MKAWFCKNSFRLFVSASMLSLSSAAQSAPVVDVLVLYVDAAQQTSSGRDMDARIASYIAYSNKAFENSDVEMRFRLVGAEKVNLDYTYVTEDNLSALRTNREVAQLRQKYGADLVTLINRRHSVSGGYVCGIGYVPPGNAGTGRLYSNASSAAFSLVGVDCGLGTFAHELGHNMSLGHSYLQNSEGGVWSWGRGHGVQGLFSTLMAYPQSYGTRNQVQQFSNPNQRTCSDQVCGREQSHREGADAAANLNNLGSQIEAFMPKVVETDPVDSGAGEPALPVCDKDSSEDNLIVNGEFDSLDGWRTVFNLSRLTQVETSTDGCTDTVLAVTNRTQLHSDVYQDLSSSLRVGRDYSLSAKFSVGNASRDTVRLALRIQENGYVRYQYLQSVSVTSNEFTAYSDSFRLDATSQPDSVGLLIYGPEVSANILADEVVLRENASQTPTETGAPLEGETVLHERFERSADGWSSYGGSRTSFSSHAFEGTYSIRNHSRDYTYSGPIRDVTGLFEPGTTYDVSAQVYVSDTSATSSMTQIWIYYVDDQGGHWVEAANANVATNGWREINGNFNISPIGSITQMRLLIGGPQTSAELYIDELTATRQ